MERIKKINVKELLIHKAKAYMKQTIDPDLELNNILYKHEIMQTNEY